MLTVWIIPFIGIHRITSHTLKRKRQYFPISKIFFEYDPSKKETWISIFVDRGEIREAATDVRNNTTSFEEVESTNEACRKYE